MPRLRILDYPILLLAAAVVAASAVWSAADRNGTAMVEIRASGETYLMPLSSDGRLVVEGPVGETVVEIHDGTAYVVDSDCRDRLCVSMGGISKAPGWIACLPNRVFVTITGGSDAENEADAVAF